LKIGILSCLENLA